MSGQPGPPIKPAELQQWLDASGETAASLARTIGTSGATIGRWIKGSAIPEPSEKLLRLLIRGELPFGILPIRSHSVLEFTPEEWSIIEVLRVREGFPDAHAWIATKIRAYLAMSGELSPTDAAAAVEHQLSTLRAAEESPSYPAGEKTAAEDEAQAADRQRHQ